MFIVGLTGGIATGKSTVSDIFKEHGIPVIDADVIARKVVEPGRKAWKGLKQAFGNEIFHENGQLNRDALGDIIFDNATNRKKLNEITHPEIYKEIVWSTIKCFFQGHQFVVMDLPLLFETAYMLEYIYKIIVVTCEEDLQLQRLMERSRISESKAKIKIASQMSLESKCEKADFVVENSSSSKDTRDQVIRIIENLRASKHHWKIRFIVGLLSTGFLSIITLMGYVFLR
ncbi:hypothetical protein PGB90_003333 [Kerria lacca]